MSGRFHIEYVRPMLDDYQRKVFHADAIDWGRGDLIDIPANAHNAVWFVTISVCILIVMSAGMGRSAWQCGMRLLPLLCFSIIAFAYWELFFGRIALDDFIMGGLNPSRLRMTCFESMLLLFDQRWERIVWCLAVGMSFVGVCAAFFGRVDRGPEETIPDYQI